METATAVDPGRHYAALIDKTPTGDRDLAVPEPNTVGSEPSLAESGPGSFHKQAGLSHATAMRQGVSGNPVYFGCTGGAEVPAGFGAVEVPAGFGGVEVPLGFGGSLVELEVSAALLPPPWDI